jgi:hypothetical protein
MSQSIDWATWWNLQLRIARGKTLSEQVLALGRNNAELRSRVDELEREIRRVAS